MDEYIQFKMHLKNDGLTVGELSVTIAVLIIIGFIWTNLNKDKGNQEVSIFINNSSQISSIQSNTDSPQKHLLVII